MAKKIKIYGDASKGCIFFEGSTVDPKFLGTIICDINPNNPSRLVIKRTDKITPTGEYRKLFRKLNPSRVQNEAGENLVDDLGYSVTDVAEYINGQANVTDTPVGGFVFQGATSLDFIRDETDTSILFSNGDHHGINSVKAVAKENGKVSIRGMRGDFEFYELEYTSCTIGGASAGNTLETVVNNLNALFTRSAVTAPSPKPFYTQLDGVDVSWNSYDTIDPVGSGIHASDSGTHYHGPRVWTSETISQPGEYFTFEAKNIVAGGGPLLGIGLYSVADGDLLEIESGVSTPNSGHEGYFFSNWLYNYSGYSAPWTTYGSKSSLSYGPGWSYSGNTPMFRYSDAHDAFRSGGTALFKCGITDEGFVGVWYYDVEDPNSDGLYGARTNDWILLARSSTPLPEGQYGLLVKIPTTSAHITSPPRRFASDPVAPTLYYRYIESPDGNFEYPLFATEIEANYVDQLLGGSGTSHEHMYADDSVPGTIWYMPMTGSTMDGTSAPVDPVITYTEIPTQDDSNFAPPSFSGTTLTLNEGELLNYQLAPADVNYTTTISTSIPGWSVTSDGRLIGVAPEVDGDNVTNPSDFTTVVVTRTNEFGSSVGVLTVLWYNLTAPTVDTGSWTADSAGDLVGSVLQPDSLATLSITLSEGERLLIPSEWVDEQVQPNTGLDALEKVYLGLLKPGTNTDAITLGDFSASFRWEGSSYSSYHYVRLNDQLGAATQSQQFLNNGASIYDYAMELYNGELWLIACHMDSINTEPAAALGGNFQRSMNCGPVSDDGLSAPLTIKVGTHAGTTLDLDDALTTDDITKITIPDPPAEANDTDWNKAIDFSGSSERMQQTVQGASIQPLRMGDLAALAGAPASAGLTSADNNSRPWATAIVFKADGHNSNQHIWNQGEGSGTSDDNIYLRLSSDRKLYLGWGRPGEVNECFVADISLSISGWHGVYIASTGERLSAGNADAANLAECFDIRYTRGNLNWDIGTNLSTSANWTAGMTGARMDKTVAGYLSVGGRQANRSFHGKVASMVITTLERGVAMPTDAEIEEMITDPVGWLSDYKVGSSFRRPQNASSIAGWSLNDAWSAYATQVWLMGDGTNDSYSNMIRNQAFPTDQNYTKLNLVSMVSNDIQTVTISGLTS